jgi:hypothetical protein
MKSVIYIVLVLALLASAVVSRRVSSEGRYRANVLALAHGSRYYERALAYKLKPRKSRRRRTLSRKVKSRDVLGSYASYLEIVNTTPIDIIRIDIGPVDNYDWDGVSYRSWSIFEEQRRAQLKRTLFKLLHDVELQNW